MCVFINVCLFEDAIADVCSIVEAVVNLVNVSWVVDALVHVWQSWMPALATVTCETSQVLLVGVSGSFPQGTPVSPHLPIGLSRYEGNNL